MPMASYISAARRITSAVSAGAAARTAITGRPASAAGDPRSAGSTPADTTRLPRLPATPFPATAVEQPRRSMAGEQNLARTRASQATAPNTRIGTAAWHAASHAPAARNEADQVRVAIADALTRACA